jgi:aspartyl protease family protein
MLSLTGHTRRTIVMQFFLIFAVVMLALAAVAPRFLTHLTYQETSPVVVTNAVPEAAGARIVAIARGENGHFATDAMIGGRRFTFLVDTGATVIALREGDAARLGVHPARWEYTVRIATANGTVLAAPVELDRVEVGDLLVRHVAAVVLPDAALAQNLLGMSFLSQVHWQYQGGNLVLEQ